MIACDRFGRRRGCQKDAALALPALFFCGEVLTSSWLLTTSQDFVH